MAEAATPKQPRLSRRSLLRAGISGAAFAGIGYGVFRAATAPAVSGRLVTPIEAHDLTARGVVTLVDIRRPDEWQRSGLGQGAHPLDMRRDDFTDALAALVEGDRTQPIVLICAGGVRSKHMARNMADAGFSQIIDVPEGMLGSRAGPGWLRRGLPVTPYTVD